MFYDNNFKKAIITMHQEYIKNKSNIHDFINLIKKVFGINRSTFYNWKSTKEIVNLESKKNYKNNNITPIAEQIILINKDKQIKKIKKELKNAKIFLNSKIINYVIKNNKNKKINDIQIKKTNFIILSKEQINFIKENSKNKTKEIKSDFIKKFNIHIHEKQIVDVLYEHKQKVLSFYKKTPKMIEYIIGSIKENRIITAKDLKSNILKELHIDVSLQLIYNVLKEEKYVFKKIKKVNNPYTIEEQIKQIEKVKETHNLKNLINCVSLDEISVVINSKPRYGWFKKNEEPNYYLKTPKITNKRYTILMASNNKKILHYTMCEQGIKTDDFIKFMKELKDKNENKDSYYLLDNMITHKTKKFTTYALENKLKMVYNAPYHSEINPIENIFSMFRNKLNRTENHNIECIQKITNDFIKENNEIKFKNIFEHSINLIDEFLNKHKK